MFFPCASAAALHAMRGLVPRAGKVHLGNLRDGAADIKQGWCLSEW